MMNVVCWSRSWLRVGWRIARPAACATAASRARNESELAALPSMQKRPSSRATRPEVSFAGRTLRVDGEAAIRTLLRECYAELDRPRTDPGAPILTWRDS